MKTLVKKARLKPRINRSVLHTIPLTSIMGIQRKQINQILRSHIIQTKPTVSKLTTETDELANRIQSLKGGGLHLSATERDYFEPRFGTDFSQVRIHNDPGAATVARSIKAKAFTQGRDVIFGSGEYSPGTRSGRRLLAHELTHTLQQSGANAPLVKLRSGTRIAKADLDLNLLDKELKENKVLTQPHGVIGGGATRGKRMSTPNEDRKGLPITAYIYPRYLPAPVPDAKVLKTCRPYGQVDPKCPREDPRCIENAMTSYKRCIKREMAPKYKNIPPPRIPTVPDAKIKKTCRPYGQVDPRCPREDPRCIKNAMTSYKQCIKREMTAKYGKTTFPPAERAIIVSGIHGDERGPLDLVKQLQTKLAAAKNPLARDFDTVVIPVMNPWGVKKRKRFNQRGVDLNRNFPGLPGAKKPRKGAKIPPQPEVKAVRAVIEKLKPQRILAMHAMNPAKKIVGKRRRKIYVPQGGVFADPVEGEARELACRMALRMRGTSDKAVPSNLLKTGVCSSRYPSQASVSVTTRQSSLGAWGSTLKTASGKRTLVITHEVPGKRRLVAKGRDRSVATIMPGLSDFLRDNSKAASEADALLRKAVRDTFLIGKQNSVRDQALLKSTERIVDERFKDMAAHYKYVWRSNHRTAMPVLPKKLRKTQTRSYAIQAGIVNRELRKRRITSKSSANNIEKAIKDIMKTMSLPGFSRHHWGTEIDIMAPPVRRADWTKPRGKYTSLIPFLEKEAPKFGFFHPYSSPRPYRGKPQYINEPWHLSYASVSNVLQAEWLKRFSGTKLNHLIRRTANAIRGKIPLAKLVTILTRLNLAYFHSNVAKSKK